MLPRAWWLKFRFSATIATVVLTTFTVALALKAPSLAYALTREGGLVESVQIVPLLAGLGIAAHRVVRTFRQGDGLLYWLATAWLVSVALLKELELENAFVVAPQQVHLFGTNFLTTPLLSVPHKVALLGVHGATLLASAYLLRRFVSALPTAWQQRDEWVLGLTLWAVAFSIALLADKSRVWLPLVGGEELCYGSLNEVRRLVSQCIEEPWEFLSYVMLAWSIGWMPLTGVRVAPVAPPYRGGALKGANAAS